MQRRYSLPFKTLIGTEVESQAWHYRLNGSDWQRIQDGESVPAWDYLAELEFSRELRIDGTRVRTSCGIAADSAIDLVITLLSSASRFRSVLFRTGVRNDVSDYSPSFRAPSSSLAESMRIEIELVLVSSAHSSDPFAPRMSGSRLFADVTNVFLEGTQSRMPIEMASFASQLPWLNAPHAPWFVSCGGGDLHAPVMRDLRVFLNADQATYSTPARDGNPLLVGLIGADVAASLLMMALDDSDFLAGSTDFAEGSMGEAASRLALLCFPRIVRKDIAQLVREHPAKFLAGVRSTLVSNHV